MTPIWPLLPVQTGSQCFKYLKNHISTTARGKLKLFASLYRSLIVKKIFTRRWPQFDLYFLSKPEVKCLIYSKNHISTTTRGKFKTCWTIVQIVNCQQNIYNKVTPIWPLLFASLYRSLIVNKYLQEGDPNLTFTSCPNRKLKFNI